ncbi:thioesterase family protein [Bradyrhizobium sp. WSM1743]|uniref:thioesterase family protein n=1 Tax=Bradyrhizobium sp. WSM1743 TaxID=318996 RepID=UPI0007C4FEA3|nr:thioesterase family protein [Bradyrhizobium sp. WSM1743]
MTCATQPLTTADASAERRSTSYSVLTSAMERHEGAWTACPGEDWRQGRTLFGGLTAALCLEAAAREFTDLPPLRSAQFALMAPHSGTVRIRAELLRRGKSAAFVSTDLSGESGLATRATLCFAQGRHSAHSFQGITAPAVAHPDLCRPFPRKPKFAQHFDAGFAGGSVPYSEAEDPTTLLWYRFRDDAKNVSLPMLTAIADAAAPAMMARVREMPPLSTMTWAVHYLSEQPTTENGWWLLRTSAESARNGYTTESVTIWNSTGEPILVGRQTLALFA